MDDPCDVVNLNFKLDDATGIITYDTIPTSTEFQDHSRANCQRLFRKLHQKFKDRLAVLYQIIYIDRQTRQMRSAILNDREVEAIITSSSEVIELDFVALYLKNKNHSEEFVRTHACNLQLLSLKDGNARSAKTGAGRLEDERQLKKVRVAEQVEEEKTKKKNGQSVFANNGQGKQTIMSFFGRK